MAIIMIGTKIARHSTFQSEKGPQTQLPFLASDSSPWTCKLQRPDEVLKFLSRKEEVKETTFILQRHITIQHSRCLEGVGNRLRTTLAGLVKQPDTKVVNELPNTFWDDMKGRAEWVVDVAPEYAHVPPPGAMMWQLWRQPVLALVDELDATDLPEGVLERSVVNRKDVEDAIQDLRSIFELPSYWCPGDMAYCDTTQSLWRFEAWPTRPFMPKLF